MKRAPGIISSLFFFLTPVVLSAQDFTWQEFSFGAPALTIQMPSKPLPQESQLPDNVLPYIRRYDAFYIQSKSKDMVIKLMHATYSDGITADMKGAANGTIDQWKKTGAGIELQAGYERKISSRNGWIQKGLYFMDGKEYAFTILTIADQDRLWSVSIIIDANNSTLQQAMRKILDSPYFKQ